MGYNPLLLSSEAPQVFVACLSSDSSLNGLPPGTLLWELPEAVPKSGPCKQLGVVEVPPGAIEALEGCWKLLVALPETALLNFSPYRPPVGVQAAGGVIVRDTAQGLEVLLIYRRGYWDLPKGKCALGETIECCALREVSEELGIASASLQLLRLLGHTLHAYPLDGAYAVKLTHWFLMKTTAQAFHPQHEEEILAVTWQPLEKALQQVGYATLRAVLAALQHWTKAKKG